MNYSKYHLSRIFASVSGFTIHECVQRRRLTEAAKLLVFTDKSIMEISLRAGYETQQSFTIEFKKHFKLSPQKFRKKSQFFPLQLKMEVSVENKVKGDKIMDICTVNRAHIMLVGYVSNMSFGFISIAKCWNSMHAKKHLIKNKVDSEFLIGLHNYSKCDFECQENLSFDYYASAEVSDIEEVSKGMEVLELPSSKYIVFSFTGNSKDSMEPVANYIYKGWFPQSTCQFNDKALYDFVKYGEATDDSGENLIEYWIPIL